MAEATAVRLLKAQATVVVRPPLVLEVRGTPVPKGAVSAFVVPGASGRRARAVVVQGGSKARRSKLAEWCSAIADNALRSLGVSELEVACFVGCPVEVEVEFRMPRPKSHYFTGKRADVRRPDAPTNPIGTPDVDKLVRAALDALIGVAFDDDSRVARLFATKVYADAGKEGARIRVAALGANHLRSITTAPPPPVDGTLEVRDGGGTLILKLEDISRKSDDEIARDAAAGINARNARNAKLRAAAGPLFDTHRAMLADACAHDGSPLDADGHCLHCGRLAREVVDDLGDGDFG